MLSNQIKHNIKEHAIREFPNECAGFVINDEIYPCTNLSPIAKNHFYIKPEDYLRASYKGKIQFVYHSHNQSPDFSEFDKLNLCNHKLRGLLYCKSNDRFKIFLPETYNNKYVGREFQIGVSDCLSLVTEYYKNELNVTLPEIKREDGWYKKNPGMINENIPATLEKVDIINIQKNDIIVFDMLGNGNPSHFGVYLGGETFLHHPRHKLSTIELLGDKIKEKVSFGLRIILDQTCN